jgi:hypothetical protein
MTARGRRHRRDAGKTNHLNRAAIVGNTRDVVVRLHVSRRALTRCSSLVLSQCSFGSSLPLLEYSFALPSRCLACRRAPLRRTASMRPAIISTSTAKPLDIYLKAGLDVNQLIYDRPDWTQITIFQRYTQSCADNGEQGKMFAMMMRASMPGDITLKTSGNANVIHFVAFKKTKLVAEAIECRFKLYPTDMKELISAKDTYGRVPTDYSLVDAAADPHSGVNDFHSCVRRYNSNAVYNALIAHGAAMPTIPSGSTARCLIHAGV